MNSELPNDHLDPLLRQWHQDNAARAAALRDATLARVSKESGTHAADGAAAGTADGTDVAGAATHHPAVRTRARSFWLGRGLAAAAAIALAVTAAIIFPILPSPEATASSMCLVPDGGRLQACDRQGQVLGACPLQHTDVSVDVAGPFTRVTLVQKFANPYRVPIEAVYTFPLGERSAVDRMRMTVRGPGGERIVEGVVKERNMARFIYEAARERGYVASLLEQERPNIFTQSVANIEPGATVDVEISYVETLAMKDGVYEFAFPMVVTPRYIPGQGTNTTPIPSGWTHRCGVILLGPASYSLTGDPSPGAIKIIDPSQPAEAQQAAIQDAAQRALGAQAAPTVADAAQLAQLAAQVEGATPVNAPDDAARAALGQPTKTFRVTYADGSAEPGALYANGAGSVGQRWFIVAANNSPSGGGFAQNTNQVPDASRITPMPVRPDVRAGHDISVRVNIDTGGPAMKDLSSQLHGIDVKWTGNSKCALQLQGGATIPNKDFVLRWGLNGNSVLEGAFSYASVEPLPVTETAKVSDGSSRHVGTLGAAPNGFFTLVMTPPPAVTNAQVLPRELVFVLDTSGSMSGRPIEKSKEVMQKTLASMRAEDTFNVVTFAGTTAILWPELRKATPDNIETARKFVNGLHAGGGTEMMKAIDAALVQMPGAAPVVQPDGSVSVPPRTPVNPAGSAGSAGGVEDPKSGDQLAKGPPPMRIAVFLTDGEVGNDQGIIDAVARNANTTRVFTFGIGNSINRYLLEEMAHRGRGACDIVLTTDDADKAVNLFTRRIQTPLLQDITVTFEGVQVGDIEPSGALLPDLFDMQPLVIHGRWNTPGTGTAVIRGRTPQGPYERKIPVTLDVNSTTNSMLPQLWARKRVDTILAPVLRAVEQQTLAPDIRAKVVALGEQFHLMTPYTSFVAVERSRAIVGGRPMLVQVPIEFPEGLQWEGFFGGVVAGSDSWCNETVAAAVRQAAGLPTIDSQIDAHTEALTGIDFSLADDTKNGADRLSAASAGQSVKAKAELSELETTGGLRVSGQGDETRKWRDAERDVSLGLHYYQSGLAPSANTPTLGRNVQTTTGAPSGGAGGGGGMGGGGIGSRSLSAGSAAPEPARRMNKGVTELREEAGRARAPVDGKPGLPVPPPPPPPPAPPAPRAEPAAQEPAAPPVSAPVTSPSTAPGSPPAAKKEAEAARKFKESADGTNSKDASAGAPKPAAQPAAQPAAKPKPEAQRMEPPADAAEKSQKFDAPVTASETSVNYAAAGSIYLVQTGDTLSGISLKSYGSADQWKLILDANTVLLKGNEKGLQPGMQLVIPPAAGTAAPTAPADPKLAPPPPPAPVAPPQQLAEELRDRLVRVLEKRLLALALYQNMDPKVREKYPPLPAEVLAVATVQNGQPVTTQVNILVAKDSAAEVRRALEKAGFTFAAEASAPEGKRLIMGTAEVKSLMAHAQIPSVLRIEPLQMEEATASAR